MDEYDADEDTFELNKAIFHWNILDKNLFGLLIDGLELMSVVDIHGVIVSF